MVYAAVRKSRFMKKQEAKRILSSLGLKTPLRKIPLEGNILFWIPLFHWILVVIIK